MKVGEVRAGAYRSDPALVQACIDGEEGAWYELVERYSRLVYSIALRNGFPAADADDVVQNVFLIALRRLTGLRDQTRLSSWLITTTYRECWRLRRREPAQDELDEALPDAGEPVGADLLRWEREQQVHEALGRIDERCRELLSALFLEEDESSYAVIAERLGVPVGSIGPTRARCFKKLEKALGQVGFTGES
ncbi:MAG: sigma-70 family RNA polymerase sigma factor [Chloroflexota bacterium]|nr:sigma-70 family RNA polymerase sigma factor [Chloroflexota bacterium]